MELETLFRTLVEALRAKDPSRLHQPHRLRDIQYGLVPYRVVRETIELSCSEDHEMLLLRMCSGEGGFLEIADTDAVKAFDAEVDGVNPDLSLLQIYGDIDVRLASSAIDRALAEPEAVRAAAYAPPSDEEIHNDDAGVPEAETSNVHVPVPPPVPDPIILHTPLDGPTATPPPEELPPLTDGEEESESEVESVPDEDSDDWERAASAPATNQADSEQPPPPFDIVPTKPAVAQCDFCGCSLPADREANFCPHCGQNLTMIRCARCSAELEWGWRHCITCGQPVTDA